jgi:glycosyltransferase involved in cell wall biosynthesis
VLDNPPLVSGILIFLNAGAFLNEAIESVLSQTCRAWELILVDDGSSDASTEIAQSYARKHSGRIVYLDHKGHVNRGKSTSRNVGIRAARGRYIAFLDADDVWFPEKLERQAAILAAHPDPVMVYGPTQCWYSWNAESRSGDEVTDIGLRPQTAYDGVQLLTAFLKRPGIVPGICSLLARRDCVVRVGGFDEALQHMYEDQTLIAKLCVEGAVFVDDGCWDRYRQHSGSTSAQAIKEGFYHPWRPNRARLQFLQWLEQYVTKATPDAAELLRIVRREKWLQSHQVAGTIAAGFGIVQKKVRTFLGN